MYITHEKISLYSSNQPTRAAFNGLFRKTVKPVVATDIFDASKLRIKSSQFYTNITQKIKTYTIKDIKAIVKDLSIKYPEEDILLAMQALTQFSNTNSLSKLHKELSLYKIGSFRSVNTGDFLLSQIYAPPEKNKLEADMYYKLPIGYLAGLTDIFSYFFDAQTGKYPLKMNSQRATILDKKTLNILKEFKENATNEFNKRYKDYKFFYINNFENSYNIFEQHQDLKEFTTEFMNKLTLLKKTHNNKSTSELIDILLNQDSINLARDLGINLTIINKPQAITTPTAKEIASNLSYTTPMINDFANLLETSIKKITPDKNLQAIYLEDIMNKFKIYTYKDMAKKLQDLKVLIEEQVKSKDKDIDKIYYYVPNLTKSFGLIAYMYQKINNIPPARFIDIMNCYVEELEIEELDKNATLVVLDDASITGESFLCGTILDFNKDYDILFATILSTSKAKENFARDENFGKISLVSADYQDFSNQAEEILKNKRFKNHSMILFPYNAPDNNIPVLRNFTSLFYPASSFVQESWDY